MEKWVYVMFIERGKDYNKINREMVVRHVDFIRNLDDEGKLVLCGPFKGYHGVAGMVILKTESYEEADAICKTEPFVANGYATYKLRALKVGDRENNYLL